MSSEQLRIIITFFHKLLFTKISEPGSRYYLAVLKTCGVEDQTIYVQEYKPRHSARPQPEKWGIPMPICGAILCLGGKLHPSQDRAGGSWLRDIGLIKSLIQNLGFETFFSPSQMNYQEVFFTLLCFYLLAQRERITILPYFVWSQIKIILVRQHQRS